MSTNINDLLHPKHLCHYSTGRIKSQREKSKDWNWSSSRFSYVLRQLLWAPQSAVLFQTLPQTSSSWPSNRATSSIDSFPSFIKRLSMHHQSYHCMVMDFSHFMEMEVSCSRSCSLPAWRRSCGSAQPFHRAQPCSFEGFPPEVTLRVSSRPTFTCKVLLCSNCRCQTLEARKQTSNIKVCLDVLT